MATNNFVFLRGSVVSHPFFNLVADKETQEKESFLRFIISVPRDGTQPGTWPSDRFRVVMYGEPARRTYPLLEHGTPVSVTGWLQYRQRRRRVETEVVAQQLTVGQPIGQDIEEE